MILVMTGTHNQGFDRLIKAVDELAEKFPEKFFIQTGNSKVKPKNCEWKQFLTPTELEKKIKESSLVITHAGSGSILNCLKNRKQAVVVPREKRFNEHLNDHQFEIAEALGKQKKVVVCRDLNNLKEAIKKAKKIIVPKQKSNPIIKEIELFLGE